MYVVVRLTDYPLSFPHYNQNWLEPILKQNLGSTLSPTISVDDTIIVDSGAFTI